MNIKFVKMQKYNERYGSVLYAYIILITIFTIFSIFFPIFRSQKNISNILIQIAPLAIVALGQNVVLIGGGVDLSVGAIISMATVVAANFMDSSLSGVLFGLLLIIACATFIGFINGIICNETNVPPLIVTLCTANIIQGIVLWYRADPGGSIPKIFRNFMLYKIGILSTPVIIVIILYILFSFGMSRSVFGLYTYSLGGNEEYARMTGINVKMVRIGTYVISAILASIAGMIIGSRLASGSPLVGNPFMLDSLIAAIVGGTGFSGGQGFVVGSFAGAWIVAMISNALNISNVSPFYQYIGKGVLLIFAMILNSLKRKWE